MWRHGITAHFRKVSGHHAKIQAIKHDEEAKVHGGLRFDEEQHVETEHGEHYHDVTENPWTIADLVDEQKPLVHQSAINDVFSCR